MLTEQRDAWIAARCYSDDCDAKRDLVRREQERSFEIETVRQVLIEGEQSGEPDPLDFAAFKRHTNAKYS